MIGPNGRPWLLAPLALAVAVAAGCEPGVSSETRARLATLDTVEAQRDSLFVEVADNARLLNDLSAELDKVEGLATDSTTAESPLNAQRDALRQKVQQVTARLAGTEQRLASSRAQLRRTREQADTLKGRVSELEQMVAGFEEMVESQRVTITSLTDRVTALEAQTLALQDTTAALRDTVSTMAERQSTAYYAVGTKQELIDRGIIVKEGGARVLFIFGKTGETLRPARELDPSEFTAINLREVTEIPLPDSTAEYTIASRQDLSYLAQPPEKDGRIRGQVVIGAPEQFWLPSKFLILVKS